MLVTTNELTQEQLNRSRNPFPCHSADLWRVMPKRILVEQRGDPTSTTRWQTNFLPLARSPTLPAYG